jgi:prepilin-type N-terminal cleavage/methylation domain-containing protein
MQHLRSKDGVTLIELVIVVAIIAVLIGISVPTMGRHFRRQDARHHAQKIASAIQDARSRAVKEGNNYFLHFDFGGQGQVRIVDDDDNNWALNGTEQVGMVTWELGSDPQVTRYGATAGPPPANTVPEDGGGAIPATGYTLPTDATLLPAIGFNTRGIPVALTTTGDWSSGFGSYYVTDNGSTVYAITVLPLGGVRVRVYEPGTANWL